MRKKLFAILMSAMMMVTFMPAMAFAADNTFYVDSWNADYTKVTGHYTKSSVEYTKTIDTNRAMLNVGASEADKGKIAAKPLASDLTALGLNTTAQNGKADARVVYYDWNALKMVIPTMSYATFADEFIANGAVKSNVTNFTGYTFTATAPSYDTDNTGDNRTIAGRNFDDINVKLNVTGYDVTKPYVDQTVTFTATVTPKDAKTAKYFTGELAPVAVKVLGKEANPQDIALYVDSVKVGNELGDYFQYDGAAHTVVTSEVPGYEVSYTQVNPSTNRYEAVAAPTFKDAGSYDFTVTIKNATTKAVVGSVAYKTVTVSPAGAPAFEFTKNDATGATATVFDVEEGFDAMKYIVVKAANTPAPAGESEGARKIREEKNAANKKATTADEALLLEYFNDYYTIAQTPAKFDATKITAVIKAKTLTTAEEATLNAKYAKTVLNNFTKPVLGSNTEVTFNVVAGGDIDWVEAPLTVVYKNKQTKLTKSHTIAIEAKADTKVTYKLSGGGSLIKIDKATGKITVKKGLKRGTYKVTVTANAGKATDSYVLTIKLAKK